MWHFFPPCRGKTCGSLLFLKFEAPKRHAFSSTVSITNKKKRVIAVKLSVSSDRKRRDAVQCFCFVTCPHCFPPRGRRAPAGAGRAQTAVHPGSRPLTEATTASPEWDLGGCQAVLTRWLSQEVAHGQGAEEPHRPPPQDTGADTVTPPGILKGWHFKFKWQLSHISPTASVSYWTNIRRIRAS